MHLVWRMLLFLYLFLNVMVQNCESRLGGDNPISCGSIWKINALWQCFFLQYLWFPKRVASELLTDLLIRSCHCTGPHSIWEQNGTWPFFFQVRVSALIKGLSSTHLTECSSDLLSHIFTILSLLIDKRYMCFAGCSSFHQWLKTQERVKFVLPAQFYTEKQNLSQPLFVTFPHFVQGRTLLGSSAITFVWSESADAGFPLFVT